MQTHIKIELVLEKFEAELLDLALHAGEVEGYQCMGSRLIRAHIRDFIK